MFGNKEVAKTNRNNRTLSPWTSSLAPRNLGLRSALSPFSSLRDDIMDIFDDFSQGLTQFTSSDFVPRIEVKDQGNSYVVSAEVPGMSEQDMNVSVDGHNLVLEGEKKEEHKEEDKKGMTRSEFSYGSFYRAIPLTEEIDPEKITAAYKDGILKVTVEKRPEAQRKAKKIPINVEGKAALKH